MDPRDSIATVTLERSDRVQNDIEDDVSRKTSMKGMNCKKNKVKII